MRKFLTASVMSSPLLIAMVAAVLSLYDRTHEAVSRGGSRDAPAVSARSKVDALPNAGDGLQCSIEPKRSCVPYGLTRVTRRVPVEITFVMYEKPPGPPKVGDLVDLSFSRSGGGLTPEDPPNLRDEESVVTGYQEFPGNSGWAVTVKSTFLIDSTFKDDLLGDYEVSGSGPSYHLDCIDSPEDLVFKVFRIRTGIRETASQLQAKQEDQKNDYLCVQDEGGEPAPVGVAAEKPEAIDKVRLKSADATKAVFLEGGSQKEEVTFDIKSAQAQLRALQPGLFLIQAFDPEDAAECVCDQEDGRGLKLTVGVDPDEVCVRSSLKGTVHLEGAFKPLGATVVVDYVSEDDVKQSTKPLELDSSGNLFKPPYFLIVPENGGKGTVQARIEKLEEFPDAKCASNLKDVFVVELKVKGDDACVNGMTTATITARGLKGPRKVEFTTEPPDTKAKVRRDVTISNGETVITDLPAGGKPGTIRFKVSAQVDPASARKCEATGEATVYELSLTATPSFACEIPTVVGLEARAKPKGKAKGTVIFTVTKPDGTTLNPPIPEVKFNGDVARASFVADMPGNYFITAIGLPPRCRSNAHVVVIEMDIAMDGNRDGTIDFNNNDDKSYEFWVNDDDDGYHMNDWPLQYLAEDDLAVAPDWISGIIDSPRDLEDFTRLAIKANIREIDPSVIEFSLRWDRTSGGNPRVGIYESADLETNPFGMDYLYVKEVAEEQMSKRRIMYVDKSTVIPRQHFTGGEKVFLLEGAAKGSGQLTLVARLGKDECLKHVDLSLRSAEEFTRRYHGNTQGRVMPDNRLRYSYRPKDDDFIIYVHGWNMGGNFNKYRWAETMFKRLWWQGYTGHCGLFSWDELSGVTTFNESELRAWQTGPALYNLLSDANIPSRGRVRVLAHSQGNVVVGEALRIESLTGVGEDPNVILAYLASQAAISAHCYDNHVTYMPGETFRTPDHYSYYYSGSPAPKQGRQEISYLANLTHQPYRMANLCNPFDWALQQWRDNNRTKPRTGYEYSGAAANVYNQPPDHYEKGHYVGEGEGIFIADESLLYEADRHEIFAFCAQSRSRALGAETAITTFNSVRRLNEEMNPWYDDGHYSHSRQFRSNIIDEWNYWRIVMEEAGLPRSW